MRRMGDGGVVAVVLGGGGPSDRLARSVGAPSKALVPLAGAPLGAYVVAALRDSGAVREVIWVGATDARLAAMVDAQVPSGARMIDSLTLGLGAALGRGSRPRVLVVTADVPWWTGEGVRRFVADAPDADLVYPVVREADALRSFPDQKRTFVRIAEGRVTGGNAVLLRASAITALLPWIDRAYRARKQPLQLAALVGWRTLLDLLTGRATLPQLEARIGRLVGIDGRVFVSGDAAIAADVDAPEHLTTTPALAPIGLGTFGSGGGAV
jgi:molybdopterin-guanine dinucleotide biosynthesis protein A